MSYLEGTEQLRVLLMQQSSLVIPNLQDIVGKLIALVDDGTLYSFEFSGNMVNASKPEGIFLYVTQSNTHRKIQIGNENSNIDFFLTSLSKENFQMINDMHKYVMFVNDYLQKSIPEILRPTKYRIDNEKKIGSDQPKVPNFAKNLLAQEH